MQTAYLFVYGTLRHGSAQPIQRLLDSQADYCGEAWYRGKLYDLGAYPGVVPSNALHQRVRGDLLQIHDQTLLELLDRYEGASTETDPAAEYRRQRVKVESVTAGEVEAWIYLYNRPLEGKRQILSGDYLAELKIRRPD